jgi:hypothetical protein
MSVQPEVTEVATPPKPTFAAAERETVEQQVHSITTNVVTAIHDVIKTAQDLEALVLQNAARVKTELDEHIELAGAVKAQAAQLNATISRLRDAQALLSAERKNGQHAHAH